MASSRKRNPFHVRPVLLVMLCAAVIAAVAVFHVGTIKVFFISRQVRDVLEPAMVQRGFDWGSPVFIRIFKESRELEIWMKQGDHFALFDTYPVCSYSGKLGPKKMEGDRQAPEGFYKVSPAQMNPNSAFHLSFNIGFPNAYDRAQQATGKDLMVHGSCVSAGCYAMTDAGIDKIYTLMKAAFDAGQSEISVHIFPFRLSPQNLERHKSSSFAAWWESFRPIYDDFEKTHVVPMVDVREGKYVLRKI